MNEDETIAACFLRVDEVVNARKGLGEEKKEHDVASKVIRSILPKCETKISTLEEKKSFSKMTLHQLQGTLTAYVSNQASSSSKESAFKAKKHDESGSDLTDALETFLVKKMRKKYKGKPKFFSCGQLGHFAAKCPNVELEECDEKTEKFSKKKPWNQNKRFKDYKKKSLLSKEDSNEESSDANEEGERLFMAEIVHTPKPESSESESSSDLDVEVDLEEELLKSSQELKNLKKLIANHETENQKI